MRNYVVRLPRKFKKRLIKLNGRGKVRTVLMLAELLYEVLHKKQYRLWKLSNVSKDGWAVKEGSAKPFEMKIK